MRLTFQQLLDRLNEVRFHRFRSDPEREQAMRDITTQTVADLLEALAEKEAKR